MATGILIEIENNAVKETSLGVMTAAAGHEIYALVNAGIIMNRKIESENGLFFMVELCIKLNGFRFRVFEYSFTFYQPGCAEKPKGNSLKPEDRIII